jgi:hypothetical protein
MDFVLMLHSLVRWLVLLAAVWAVIKFAIGWLRGGAFGGLDRGLSLGFSGLLDLQALLGLIVLIGGGLAGAGFPRYRLEHAVLMLAAVVVGHLPSRWKQAAPAIRFRNALLCVLGALLLVIAGIAVLPGGLSR